MADLKGNAIRTCVEDKHKIETGDVTFDYTILAKSNSCNVVRKQSRFISYEANQYRNEAISMKALLRNCSTLSTPFTVVFRW